MTSTLYTQLVEILRDVVCTFVRQEKGSHEIWHSLINQKNFSVPFTIKSKPTGSAILKQAGLSKKL